MRDISHKDVNKLSLEYENGPFRGSARLYYRRETKCLATDMIRFDCYHKGRQIAHTHTHRQTHHMWHLSWCVCLCSVCLFLVFALKLIDASDTAGNPQTSKRKLVQCVKFSHTKSQRYGQIYGRDNASECEVQLCACESKRAELK